MKKDITHLELTLEQLKQLYTKVLHYSVETPERVVCLDKQGKYAEVSLWLNNQQPEAMATTPEPRYSLKTTIRLNSLELSGASLFIDHDKR